MRRSYLIATALALTVLVIASVAFATGRAQLGGLPWYAWLFFPLMVVLIAGTMVLIETSRSRSLATVSARSGAAVFWTGRQVLGVDGADVNGFAYAP